MVMFATVEDALASLRVLSSLQLSISFLLFFVVASATITIIAIADVVFC